MLTPEFILAVEQRFPCANQALTRYFLLRVVLEGVLSEQEVREQYLKWGD